MNENKKNQGQQSSNQGNQGNQQKGGRPTDREELGSRPGQSDRETADDRETEDISSGRQDELSDPESRIDDSQGTNPDPSSPGVRNNRGN